MENKCDLKYPHSHLVYGKTFECEKGEQNPLTIDLKIK